MFLTIHWKKQKTLFIVKIFQKTFLVLEKKRLIKKNLLKNLSLNLYNYFLLKKILRQYGLARPLINRKDYYL